MMRDLACIREMRKQIVAPVDTIGCHMLARPDASPIERRFQILVALVLSPQTKDQATAQAMEKLYSLCPVTPSSILAFTLEKLDTAIKSVGFHRKKAENLLKIAHICKEHHNSDIPQDLVGLQKLPGVGPKIAHLTMQVAWEQTVGIGVDTHVHRIANRLHWVSTKTPEETRVALEDIVPRENWRELNPLLVGFGQTICLPVRPKCGQCSLSSTCPLKQNKL